MISEDRQRIEQIRRDGVPAGYVRTKAGMMPMDWEIGVKAKDVFRNSSVKHQGKDLTVLSATQDRGIVPRSEVDIDIKYDEGNIDSYKKVEKGDFVISLRSFQGGIELSNHEGVVSPAYTILKNKKPIDIGYYKTYFKTTDFINRLNSAVYGIRDGKQIGYEDFGDLIIHYPPLEEQKKIAQILDACDRVIELKQKLVDELKKLKKACLAKMFPQEGETVPKIRFPGFSAPWEQRKVGELLIERNEYAPKSKEYPLMAFIANEGIAEKGERYDRSALINDAENKLYKRTELGDFIYSSNNLEAGSIGFNKYGKASISPVYSIFAPRDLVDSRFIGHRLVRKDFIHRMIKWRQGVVYGQWKIHESDFLKMDVFIPSVEEQRIIGAFLDRLDCLINLYQRKIELEQKKKKALMQLLLTGIIRVR